MVEETKDSNQAPSTPVVDAPAAMPEVIEAAAPTKPTDSAVDSIVAEKPAVDAPKAERLRKPKASKARQPSPAKVATPVKTAEPVAPATVTAAKPAVVMAKSAKRGEKLAKKVRLAQSAPARKPAVAVPTAAVKPAIKRPFTASPSVKQNSAASTQAPRKELFTMATTTEMTDKMTAAFKEAQEKAKAAMEKSQAAFGDAGAFAKGNVEAMVESTKILASGLQEMTKGYVEETKSALETMTADVKELTTVKSPTEFFEKQTALMRKNFDAVVAASSKNSEAMLKLANEAFQPISTRVSLAVEKMKQAA